MKYVIANDHGFYGYGSWQPYPNLQDAKLYDTVVGARAGIRHYSTFAKRHNIQDAFVWTKIVPIIYIPTTDQHGRLEYAPRS